MKEFPLDDRLNIIKFNIKNQKFAILGIYAPCSYLKVNEESEKLTDYKKIIEEKIEIFNDEINFISSSDEDEDENSN